LIESFFLFKRPIENRLCAVKNNNEWLRGRCHLISTDKQIVKVRYIDWGNTVHIKTEGNLFSIYFKDKDNLFI
jgi:hypothetical protein